MWIDDHGVLHTVALPDPTLVMSAEFRAGLDLIAQSEHEALRQLIEDTTTRAFTSDHSHLTRAVEFVEAAPPTNLLRGPVSSANDVADAIDAVESRWRLDVVMALDDYVH